MLIRDQNLPLEKKIQLSQRLILNWADQWNQKIFISFSGGKDSTVLLHLAREVITDLAAVFIDTGMEYPEIYEFIRKVDNVTWLKPRKKYGEIVNKFGYPVIDKKTARLIEKVNAGEVDKKELDEKMLYLANAPFKISNKCCEIIKKEPLDHYIATTGQKPITGIMAYESLSRTRRLMHSTYRDVNQGIPTLYPLAFWLKEDVIQYLREYKVSYSSIYGDLTEMSEERTICMYCIYGLDYEKNPNKFQRMKESHPEKYDYAMEELGIAQVLEYLNIDYQ